MFFENVIRDGHIHSQYCPHGSNDEMEKYVKQAIKRGLKEISFTEHMPLPEGFEDPSESKDSTAKIDQIGNYIEEVKKLKDKYEGQIKINLGMEVDYIEGFEQASKSRLEIWGPQLEDGLLSVHNILIDGRYYPIDESPEVFENLCRKLAGIENLYKLYYKTLIKAVRADLGPYKPKRLGHLNLIRKFCIKFPFDYKGLPELDQLFLALKEEKFELDYNVSGKRKKYCGEIYIEDYILELVKKYDIPMVFGSDSHEAKTVGI